MTRRSCSTTSTAASVAMLLSLALALAAAPARADDLDPADTWSRRIPYLGRIEQAGVPFSGVADLGFAIYKAPSGGSAVWSETQSGVSISSGAFSVVLGADPANQIDERLYTREALYLEVTVNGVPLRGRQRIMGAPFASFATRSDQVPVGTVLDWWGPDPSSPLPYGFVECAGQTIDDPDSPYDGQTLPDLRGRFVRGTSDFVTLGSSGGSTTHHHFISADGAHQHSQNGGDLRTSTSGPFRPAEHNFLTSENGSHDHTGWTGWASEPDAHMNDRAHEVLPPWVGLKKIIRIK